jgi:hypothetical protein
MDGAGKRESEIGPKRVREIVSDVDEKTAPYGYILVAPATFSRAAYDAFREVLKARGVMEFHLWGVPNSKTCCISPRMIGSCSRFSEFHW